MKTDAHLRVWGQVAAVPSCATESCALLKHQGFRTASQCLMKRVLHLIDQHYFSSHHSCPCLFNQRSMTGFAGQAVDLALSPLVLYMSRQHMYSLCT